VTSVVIRAVICALIIILPVLLLMLSRIENVLYLVLPFLFGIPAMLLVALVLAPVELALGSAGLKNMVVPLVGGLAFMAAMFVWRFAIGSVTAAVAEMLPSFLLINFAIGAGVGVLWRVSDWVYGRFAGLAS
jgi:hypothetical protein